MKIHTFYWACRQCGASPITGSDRYTYYADRKQAEDHKPEECNNVYCHTRKNSLYYIGHDCLEVVEQERFS